MSSKLTKRHGHHDNFSVISTDTEESTTDRVTYLSQNTDGRRFEAVTPPNSVHAKKLAELAMIVQSNQRSNYKRPVAELGMSSTRITPQIKSVAYQESAPHVQEVQYTYQQSPKATSTVSSRSTTTSAQYTGSAADSQSGTYEEEQYHDSAGPATQYVVVPARDPKPYISDLSERASKTSSQAPEVYRYATDRNTGYQVKTGVGEMKVSAPNGSSEARAFDGVVSKMSSKDDHYRRDKERRVVKKSTHHKQSERSSGWGFW